MPLSHAVEPRADQTWLSRTMPEDCFAPRAPGRGGLPGAHAQDPSRIQLRSRIHHQSHLDRRGPQEPPRRLPGFRASHDRLPALLGARGALCERLHPHRAQRRRRGGVGGDASHAWVSVYCPPLGWVDFDPTNDCLVGEDHVTLAWGRDFGDVSPLRGMIVGGGRHKLTSMCACSRSLRAREQPSRCLTSPGSMFPQWSSLDGRHRRAHETR